MAPLSHTYEMNANGFTTGRVVRGLPRTTWTSAPTTPSLNETSKNGDFRTNVFVKFDKFQNLY